MMPCKVLTEDQEGQICKATELAIPNHLGGGPGSRFRSQPCEAGTLLTQAPNNLSRRSRLAIRPVAEAIPHNLALGCRS